MSSLRIYFSHLCACFLLSTGLAFKLAATEIPQEKQDAIDKQLLFLDYTHDFVSKKMYAPVAWFDNFFSDDRVLDEAPVTSALRVCSDLRFAEGGQVSLHTFLHANIRLPKANKKLKLIISDENEDSVDILPGEIVKTGFEQIKEVERVNVGLRYNVIYTMVSKLHFGAGMKADIPLAPYIRAHYGRIFPMTSASQARFTGNIIWQRIVGWKRTAQIDVEKLFSKTTLLRWSNSIAFEDPDVNYGWNSSIGFQHQLSGRNALSYSVSMSGYDDNGLEISSYRIGVRFRRNFYKDWLFYEIGPENSWPRDEYGRYLPVAAITFRLEAQFGYKPGK